jgi:type VI protein secretion system component VasA
LRASGAATRLRGEQRDRKRSNRKSRGKTRKQRAGNQDLIITITRNQSRKETGETKWDSIIAICTESDHSMSRRLPGGWDVWTRIGDLLITARVLSTKHARPLVLHD